MPCLGPHSSQGQRWGPARISLKKGAECGLGSGGLGDGETRQTAEGMRSWAWGHTQGFQALEDQSERGGPSCSWGERSQAPQGLRTGRVPEGGTFSWGLLCSLFPLHRPLVQLGAIRKDDWVSSHLLPQQAKSWSLGTAAMASSKGNSVLQQVISRQRDRCWSREHTEGALCLEEVSVSGPGCGQGSVVKAGGPGRGRNAQRPLSGAGSPSALGRRGRAQGL